MQTSVNNFYFTVMNKFLLFQGANSYGQLGHGHTNDILCPTLIPETNQSIQCVVGGGGHTLIIDSKYDTEGRQ